jgi:hypothetical protein
MTECFVAEMLSRKEKQQHHNIHRSSVIGRGVHGSPQLESLIDLGREYTFDGQVWFLDDSNPIQDSFVSTTFLQPTTQVNENQSDNDITNPSTETKEQ